MTERDWLARHPYLRPIAEFHSVVGAALHSLPSVLCCVPSWHDYVHDFQAGVPLLYSSNSTIDLKPVDAMVHSLIERLVSKPLPNKLIEEISSLELELCQIPEVSIGIMAYLLDENSPAISRWGLLRYMGWTALANYLSKVVPAFDSWRDEERWLRSYCPVCGCPPAMAQLIGCDPGRIRLLSCGCCGTRWRYQRIGCPFCEDQEHRRLGIVAIDGEVGLRIDYCDSCQGYIKTYVGEGQESLLLSDWSSLHLDVMAQDRGLKRFAASLYQL